MTREFARKRPRLLPKRLVPVGPAPRKASNIAHDTDSSVLGGSGMSFNLNTWVRMIDDVACWDVALSVDQIESLWNEGAGRPVLPPPAGR